MMYVGERFSGAAGLVPDFLNLLDPRPAIEQIDENYQHGGGWRDFVGFKLVYDPADPQSSVLKFSGDPEMRAKAIIDFRREVIILYDGDWCAVIRPDGSHRIARLS